MRARPPSISLEATLPLPSLEGAEEAAGAPAATSETSAAVGWQRDGVAVPGEGSSAMSKKAQFRKRASFFVS